MRELRKLVGKRYRLDSVFLESPFTIVVIDPGAKAVRKPSGNLVVTVA